jgi:hypothetical protein
LLVLAVTMLVAGACATQPPPAAPSPTSGATAASPEPAASEIPPRAGLTTAASPPGSPLGSTPASLPPVVCNNDRPEWWAQWKTAAPDGSQVPVVITLTCDAAVAAAWRFVNDPTNVTWVEFNMGGICLPEMTCPAAMPNIGQVVFHLRDGAGRYVDVAADAHGRVSVDHDWGVWNGWSPRPS